MDKPYVFYCEGGTSLLPYLVVIHTTIVARTWNEKKAKAMVRKLKK